MAPKEGLIGIASTSASSTQVAPTPGGAAGHNAALRCWSAVVASR
jgi:hypothetical protein